MLPNFLIVGAAKSGTTSLYNYVNQHPEIYMSPIKEPKFITSQFLKFPFKGVGDEIVEKSIVKSYDEYCKLFDLYSGEKVLGEASADNLYYFEEAIKYIKKILGNPKIITILRNPIERAFSAYTHLVRDNREALTFEEALDQEMTRKKQNWEFIWFYRDVGFYYNQIKAYLENFTQVKIYLFDDLKRNPLALVKDSYEFLEVDLLFTPDLNKKYNLSGIPENKLLHNFLTKPNILKNIVKPLIKLLITEEKYRILIDGIKNRNLKKPVMRPETKEYLKRIYYDDIFRLQDLINRDLSYWLE